MKWLPALAIALALAAIVLALTGNTAWVVTFAAVLAGCALGMVWSGQAMIRDLKVRRLVLEACDADTDRVGTRDLVAVLGTPDVIRVHSDHLRRQAAVLAQRYQNGDASDY